MSKINVRTANMTTHYTSAAFYKMFSFAFIGVVHYTCTCTCLFLPFYLNEYYLAAVILRGVAKILGKGVLDCACKILSHAHLHILTGKVEVLENTF